MNGLRYATISNISFIIENLKVIVSGGGTGGHVFPAIAIANAIKKQRPGTNILFVGAKGRIEMDKVPAAGYPIEGLWISGFHRRLTLKNLLFPFKLLSSLIRARGIVRSFKPHVAIGVGGYASGPLLKAAGWAKIPILLQEQNSYPGVTNRLLANDATKVCVVYEGMERYFDKEKIVITGNPVRQNIVERTGTKAEGLTHFGLSPNRKTVFVTGGSLGARGINEGIMSCLDFFKQHEIQVLWQTGKGYIEEMTQRAAAYTNWITPTAFIDRMDLAYEVADLIISRAGGTISELSLIGKPVILMPSPNVAEDHQTANAIALVNKQAAVMVKDDEASAKLADTIFDILTNEQKQRELSENISQLAISDAADRIANELFAMLEQRQKEQ